MTPYGWVSASRPKPARKPSTASLLILSGCKLDEQVPVHSPSPRMTGHIELGLFGQPRLESWSDVCREPQTMTKCLTAIIASKTQIGSLLNGGTVPGWWSRRAATEDQWKTGRALHAVWRCALHYMVHPADALRKLLLLLAGCKAR